MSEPVVFEEKWAKVLRDLPEFKETADAASVEDLKKMIVTCEGNIYETDKAKNADVKLNSAKDLAKEFAAPYRDAVKVQTAKIKYAVFLLESKGQDIGDKEAE
jgi:hypothetical protein